MDVGSHGLRPGEAYQWKRNLRSAGRWPATKANRSTEVARTAPPGFARVRIVPEQSVSAPLHLHLHLANGRRAELVLSDEPAAGASTRTAGSAQRPESGNPVVVLIPNSRTLRRYSDSSSEIRICFIEPLHLLLPTQALRHVALE